MSEFIAFPKIPRLKRDIIITEKLDGTNAQVFIDEHGGIRAGSRNRWIAPGDDNYGFAGWVHEHAEELLKLGPGHHYGEWYGRGIQRGYGLEEKRFALFNASRWADQDVLPACCGVVPVLYNGPYSDEVIDARLAWLAVCGSVAVPGFNNPEGIVVFHTASRQMFKVTLENDHQPKGAAAA